MATTLSLPSDVDIRELTIAPSVHLQSSHQSITGRIITVNRTTPFYTGTVTIGYPTRSRASATKSMLAFQHTLQGTSGEFVLPLPQNRFAPENHVGQTVRDLQVVAWERDRLAWSNDGAAKAGEVDWSPAVNDFVTAGDRLVRIVEILTSATDRTIGSTAYPSVIRVAPSVAFASSGDPIIVQNQYVLARLGVGDTGSVNAIGANNEVTVHTWIEKV